jgi:DNA-binding transcriptional LysR family regulator
MRLRHLQDLEDEIGFKLFDRLPRGVKISGAGKLFLEDTRRILEQVHEATMRAERLARGQTGTLRVGFVESISWHGVVPESFRQFRQLHPDAELQLHPLRSPEQVEALRSGRLDAGFVFSTLWNDSVFAEVCEETFEHVLRIDAVVETSAARLDGARDIVIFHETENGISEGPRRNLFVG